MSHTELEPAEIERLRPKLLAVAYRMLGSVSDAEDAVQDAFVRFQSAGEIESPEGWLVKATTRLCIDHLRKAKRRATYTGPWLPEPVTEDWPGASEPSELADSLSTAFLLLLETLSPAERATYLLREAFGYPTEQIAALLDKTPENVRQLATRARRRIQAKEPRFDVQPETVNALAERFFAACRTGDLKEIKSMLANDATYYSDGGGKVFAAPRPIVGVARVAKLLATVFRKLGSVAELQTTRVNGGLGATFQLGDRTLDVMTLGIGQGRVHSIYMVVNPDKLRHWQVDPRQVMNDEDLRNWWKGK